MAEASMCPSKEASVERLRVWRDAQVARAIGSGAPAFLGKPDMWFEDPHWICPTGHVSGRLLTGEMLDGRCLSCMCPVILGPCMTEAELEVLLAGPDVMAVA